MITRKQTIARVATATAALLAAGILAVSLRGGLSSHTAASSRSDAAPCVATVLPDTYYQAMAEMTACTGRGVQIPIAGTRRSAEETAFPLRAWPPPAIEP